MKHRVLPAFAVLVLLGLPAAAGDGDAIVGLWATERTDNGYSHVNVTEVDGKYRGEIVWLESPNYPDDDEEGMGGQAKVDRMNPDPELSSRPIIGLVLMHGFSHAGKNRWKGGKIYDPENGKTYKCKITLGEDGVLSVRGYIGFSMLGRTTHWTRVE
jgi:uncharacterized protein (DUF2147 family)